MRIGLTAATIVILAVADDALAQVSPGPLSEAHRSLDNTEGCFKCHGRSSEIEAMCVACHTEIGELQQAGRGLHGRVGGSDCVDCHPEHGGREFALIEWPDGEAAAFDHNQAGWPLRGGHLRIKCADCHREEFQKAPVADRIRRKDRGESWLGLETRCTSCHRDVHAGRLGEDCLKCHLETVWKPAPRFDHATTDYPLTGRHQGLDCARCHLRPGAKGPTYKPLAYAECSSCHRDPHAGQLGADCKSCHVTEGFRIVSKERFDHGRTRYPLEGGHRSVACAACHDPARGGSKRPVFDRCDSCHDDVHRGQATLAGRTVDCSACHVVAAFRPSTYSADDHRESRYPLEGRHRDVACNTCHKRQAGRVELRPRFDRCASCHADAHAGQLTRRAEGGACEGCHSTAGWKPSSFDAADHSGLDLTLEGGHADVECHACHATHAAGLPVRQAVGTARIPLVLQSACEGCHFDPHQDQLDGSCDSCHSAVAFRPAAVDGELHARYAFPLEGAHRAVPCHDCHQELREAPRPTTLVRLATRDPALTFAARHEFCTDCHKSPHGNQFASRPDGDRCQQCHSVERFVPAHGFDHQSTRFPLDGAHQDVTCRECHARVDPTGRKTMVYRPIPHTCRDCHGVIPPEVR